MAELYIRKARITDVKPIHALLMQCSNQGLLLSRSYQELYSHLRDFFVLATKEPGPIVGCCALTIAWEDLAEIRSLAVAADHQRQGWGRRLVDACLSEAVTLGLFRVFTLTYQTAFFGRLDFQEVSKDVLPQKVWSDCLRCPKFPECDETAMLMEM